MIINSQLLAAQNFGLLVEHLFNDGEVHRVATQLKPKGKNGWYIAFASSPVLVMGDWQTGITETWKPDNYQQSQKERVNIQNAIKRAERVKRQKQANATRKALKLYQQAITMTARDNFTHGYLKAKQINLPNVVRVAGELLIIPLVDYSQTPPQLINVQTINPQGIKRFITGGRVTGLCCPIGFPINEPITRLYIAEGFSTACSVNQITGYPVIAAMNANNLIPMAKIARQRWGDIELVIAGDDDYLTERKTGTNTGKEKALSAAASSHAKTAFPPFSFEQKLAGLTDWNDYAQTQEQNKKEVSA